MRIVHTSDWHLGRHFGPMSLAADQAAFCDWFVELVRSERAELVVIAGDLYDRAIAPREAIELFRDTVRRLLGAGAVVAAITGNHDGADRVAPYDDLLDASGLYLRGGYEGVGRVIRHEFSDGPADLVLVPFLDPHAAPDELGDDGEAPVERRRRRTHASVLDDAMARVRAGLSAPRSVVVAHAFVTGGEPSESERQLEVGGTGEVPASLFAGCSYAALGHLHRPQAVAGDTVRYSGTPLPYSFSEDHPKSVVVVDLDPVGAAVVSTVPVDVGRPVATVTGTMAELLDPARHPDAQQRFVRAIVTDRETVLDARARLAEVYPWVVEVRLQPAVGGGERGDDGPIDVRELTPLDATRAFWEQVEGGPPGGIIDRLLADAVAAALAEDAG